MERPHGDGSRLIQASKAVQPNRIIAGLLLALVLAGGAAEADEFDPLVAYRAAKPLNDRWQTCAATFAKGRLRTRQSSARIAKTALAHCKPQEERLRHFLVGKIGRKSAGTSIGLLRERYQSDLAAAIDKLRARR